MHYLCQVLHLYMHLHWKINYIVAIHDNITVLRNGRVIHVDTDNTLRIKVRQESSFVSLWIQEALVSTKWSKSTANSSNESIKRRNTPVITGRQSVHRVCRFDPFPRQRVLSRERWWNSVCFREQWVMALRLRSSKDVKKSFYYVWYLGAREAKGVDAMPSAIAYLLERERLQEPFKVTLQVSGTILREREGEREVRFWQRTSKISPKRINRRQSARPIEIRADKVSCFCLFPCSYCPSLSAHMPVKALVRSHKNH